MDQCATLLLVIRFSRDSIRSWQCRALPGPLWLAVALAVASPNAHATPANKAALERHFERFLGKDLNRCTTCHLPSAHKDPETLADFPHNPFGDRLKVLGDQSRKTDKRHDLATRLTLAAGEDSDGDGVDNQSELLAGANPGDPKSTPGTEQLASLEERRAEFRKFLASYRWHPFNRVQSPPIPKVKNSDWVRTPIDAFIAAEHEQRGLTPRPAAPKSVLLRRLHLDLIGLSPTPDEQRAFAEDHSSDAYEKVVDRLLNDPRHGERWARHWMDIWRYSDWAGWTDGKQVRDSQRHIWRWRDWIIDSLNADRPYDRMVAEMLAGDELAPDDPSTLRATGFLVRNYKMLSREQWLEDTVKHTAQAFLGVTLGCAKCHDHRTDPITQTEYYQVRAIFEPHQVRTDRVPGELDRAKDGLPRVYDLDKETPTHLFLRGDERTPDKDRVIQPGVPKALCAGKLQPLLAPVPVKLSRDAASPDKREFVIKETVLASEQALAKAREAEAKADAATKPELRKERELDVAIAEARHAALLAELRAERLEDQGQKDSDPWKEAAKETARLQNEAALAAARLARHQTERVQAEAQRRLEEAAQPAPENADKAKAAAAADKARKDLEAAQKKSAEATEALAKAEAQAKAEPSTAYKARPKDDYPAVSTGRRTAFAQWLTDRDNPLTARVAINHLWLRHFGRGIIATPENFGNDGARPTHPALLDWLAAQFMASGWKMKTIHRMIVTSSTYRMASTPDEANTRADPDNAFFWRMPARRMEAELIRDNLLYVSGSLDPARGGPEIDHLQGLTSKRRSVYLQSAPEKEVEFLKIFDGPSVNECYQRRSTVMPQQSLALANSGVTLAQAKILARQIAEETGPSPENFVRHAYARVLARAPSAEELQACLDFLAREPAAPAASALLVGATPSPAPIRERAAENLILVLFNHHDFVTIR